MARSMQPKNPTYGPHKKTLITPFTQNNTPKIETIQVISCKTQLLLKKKNQASHMAKLIEFFSMNTPPKKIVCPNFKKK